MIPEDREYYAEKQARARGEKEARAIDDRLWRATLAADAPKPDPVHNVFLLFKELRDRIDALEAVLRVLLEEKAWTVTNLDGSPVDMAHVAEGFEEMTGFALPGTLKSEKEGPRDS